MLLVVTTLPSLMKYDCNEGCDGVASKCLSARNVVYSQPPQKSKTNRPGQGGRFGVARNTWALGCSDVWDLSGRVTERWIRHTPYESLTPDSWHNNSTRLPGIAFSLPRPHIQGRAAQRHACPLSGRIPLGCRTDQTHHSGHPSL